MPQCEAKELRYQDGTSNKFYRTYVCNDWWLANWGRIGTTGQFKRTLALNVSDAQGQAAAKRDEKLAKGYLPYGEAAISIDSMTTLEVRSNNQRTMERLFTLCTSPIDLNSRTRINPPKQATPAVNVSEAKQTEKLKQDLLRMAGKLVDPPVKPVTNGPTPAVAAPMTMEERLAEALQKAAMKP